VVSESSRHLSGAVKSEHMVARGMHTLIRVFATLIQRQPRRRFAVRFYD